MTDTLRDIAGGKRPVRTIKHRYLFDAMMMALYTLCVYGWFVNAPPTGLDYALCDEPQHGGAGFYLLTAEAGAFEGWFAGYRIVNLACLFACMICIYHLTRFVLGCRPWMGSLAASLFMANPVHTEAVMGFGGIVELWPCLMALTALTLYASPWRTRDSQTRRWTALCLTLAAFALAVLSGPRMAGLGLVFLLYEALLGHEHPRRRWDVLPLLLVNALALWLYRDAFSIESLLPANVFAPLLFIIYPIGFLPETAARFHQHPWLGWLAAAAVAAVVALIQRKARSRVIWFGLASMCAVRLLQGADFIDPVHLTGGGALLLPNALFNVAFVALCFRMMDHPKWLRPVVTGTTLLAVFCFAMQIHANSVWAAAGRRVAAWQEQAAGMPSPLLVLPDWRCTQRAPIALCEAVVFDYGEHRFLMPRSLLPLHWRRGLEVDILDWSPNGAAVRVSGAKPINIVPWPYALANEGGALETDDAVVQTVRVEPDALVVLIRPLDEPWRGDATHVFPAKAPETP